GLSREGQDLAAGDPELERQAHAFFSTTRRPSRATAPHPRTSRRLGARVAGLGEAMVERAPRALDDADLEAVARAGLAEIDPRPRPSERFDANLLLLRERGATPAAHLDRRGRVGAALEPQPAAPGHAEALALARVVAPAGVPA